MTELTDWYSGAIYQPFDYDDKDDIYTAQVATGA